jgi:diguanylate cyclase (GGDEF)-like protein/PAS domain S-box-containing protein
MAQTSGISSPDLESRRFDFLRRYCEISAIAVVWISCLVLLGWAFQIEILMSVVPGLVTMKVNTAIALALSAISLWLQLSVGYRSSKRDIARGLAAIVVLIGVATLCEYFLSIDLHIDQLIFLDPKGSIGTASPGRLAPTTATALIALGLALVLLDWKTKRGQRPSQILSLWTGMVAIMAISGYFYHAKALDRILLYTQVAVHTALALIILSVAAFFARPRSGIAGDLTSEASGSAMARGLLPAVFFIPITLGWISLQGELLGKYGSELSLALYATATTFVFAVLVWQSARKMNVEYRHRNAAERGIMQLNAALEKRVAKRTQTLEEQTAILAKQTAMLSLSSERLSLATSVAKVGVWEWHLASNEVTWDATMFEIYGFAPIVPMPYEKWAAAVFPGDLPLVEAMLRKTIDDKSQGGAEFHITRSDGVVRIISVIHRVVLDDLGNVSRLIGVNMDITDRKEAEEALFVEKERAEVTLNSIGDAVICTDIAGNITFVNLVAERMTGWTLQEAAGRPMSETFRILDATSRETTPNPMELAIANDRVMNLPSNCILVRRDGFETPIEDSVAPIHNREGVATGAVIVFRDVSAARAMSLQLAHSAQHDFLTGLPNRMLLNDRVNQAIALAPRHTKKVAVLFLDLDGFKHINDSLGHPVGDKLLQSIAKRLVNCVRAADTVSRQGGDEFVVLLSEVEQAEDAAITARRMLQAVAEAHDVDHHDLHVTTSIGLSIYPDDGLDAETLIKNADTAMYQAKENGRQSYQFFRPAMNVRAVERQSIEESLRRALEREEFSLHYQPKISLKTGEITGAEALVRWTHSTRGPVSPAQFIPVAEDCGLIVPIGNWVLREACTQARAWLDAGLPLGSIAVNISAMEFRHEHFLEGVFATLELTGLDPERLELELTESVLMKHADSTRYILKALRARGVQVAVDDFGTGCSSLSYLRRFPIDALKIDQSFVRQIITVPDETTIVTAIISMGRSLKLRVVAEGVETKEELEFLQAHDCDEVQGYYFSRPVPAADFGKLLENSLWEPAGAGLPAIQTY